MEEVVILGAVRTAIGKFNGSLASKSASELGSAVIRELLKRTGIEATQVDEVILGQVLTAGVGMNAARQASLGAGLPIETPAMAINMVCGSGLRSVHLAAQAIQAGSAELIVAGGQESMSNSPHVLPNSRNGQRMGDWNLIDTMIHDGLWDIFNGYHMGCTAENLVDKYHISREEQDAFAAASQQKTEAAQKAGLFAEEIVPIEIPQRKGDPIVFDTDEFPRHGTTAEALAKLKPAFRKDGTVTAGNASGINDGAAAVVVASASKAKALGIEPWARIVGYASAGVDPAVMGIGPVDAVRKTLKRAGWTIDDPEVIESNEAFAAQALAVTRELEWDTSRLNPLGGAIALGHPIGASGARLLVTLLHEMRRQGLHKGLGTLCIGGGQGVAIAVER